VDFVVERIDGKTLPVEVKFRKRIDPEDLEGMRTYQDRFGPRLGIVVTRDRNESSSEDRVLFVPLTHFLGAF
jgi:predicted AAA+ superfamily ATPase